MYLLNLKKKQQHIIQGCQKGDREAQSLLFDEFQGMLFGICLRYAANEMEAEDMLQEGMITIYKNLYQYRLTGSFPAWLKKVMVNSCLGELKKRHRHFVEPLAEAHASLEIEVEEEIDNPITEKHLLQFIQQLPTGYRTVFNLYVLEGYTHDEIGQYLNISANTSKSQFSRAKKMLRTMIEAAFYKTN